MEIKLTVTISDIKSWGPNWDNEFECNEELKKLRNEAKFGLARAFGIPSGDIDIESELLK